MSGISTAHFAIALAIVLIIVVLDVLALRRIWRSGGAFTLGGLIWVLLVIFVPVIGALGVLVSTRESSRSAG